MEIIPKNFERSVSDDYLSVSTDDTTRSCHKLGRFRRMTSASSADSEASDDSQGPNVLSKAVALELQFELLAEFTTPSFLKAKHTLAREHSSNTLACRAALTKLVRARQMNVLPRYGFDSSPEGVESMLRAFKTLEKDPDIYVNSVAIQDALSLRSVDNLEHTLAEPDLVTKPTTNNRVCELLRALLVEFSMASFQQDIDELKRKVVSQRRRSMKSTEDPEGFYHLPGRGALALQVYRAVLPCFGFEGSKAGVNEMILHCAEFMSNEEVSRLVDSINLKLGMTPEACKRVSAKEEVKVEKESSPERSPVVVHMPITQAKLAKTLERLSAPQNKRRGRTRQHVQDTRPEQSPEEIQLEIQKKKLKEHTIRRVIAGDGYQETEPGPGPVVQEYEGDSRLPADRQSTYAVDELHGRELTSAEQRSIMGVFREMVKSSGVAERAEQRGKEGRDASKPEEEMRGTSGAMISWSEVAKSLRGRLSNAHVQRLGVYFGLKALKGKIRYKLYEERIGLLVTATPEKRLRIAFGLLDVGGDGVLGRRDVFAALAATTFEEMEVNLKSPDQHFSNSNPYCQVEVEGKPRTRWQTKALPERLPTLPSERS
eukprot:g3375.t1